MTRSSAEILEDDLEEYAAELRKELSIVEEMMEHLKTKREIIKTENRLK